MTNQLRSYCSELLRMLTNLRFCDVVGDSSRYYQMAGRCFGYVNGLRDSGSVSREVAARMDDLIASACRYVGFGCLPSNLNAGPCIPAHIALYRAEQPLRVKPSVQAAEPVAVRAESKPARSKVVRSPSGGWMTVRVKPQAQVLANEPEQVPAPAPSRNLRLLCLLVPSRTCGTRSLPVHTLRPVPPRVCVQGRWNLASETGFHLRETHAVSPAPEVLEHYLRLGQADAIRSGPRAVSRAGGQL